MSWTEKYEPETFERIIGNGQTKTLFMNFMDSWARGRPVKKTMYLYGHSGTGKNTIINAFCKEHEVPLVTLDPCQYEDSTVFLAEVIELLNSGTFEGSTGSRIVVVDGIECVEKGIQKKLWAALRSTGQPVILVGTAKENLDYYMRRSCLELFMLPPTESELFHYLTRIAADEKLELPDRDLLLICNNSASVRSAVLNLQCLAEGSIRAKDLADKKIVLSTSEQIQRLLQGKEVDLTGDPGELAIWILDNGGQPDLIASVDIFLGRVRTAQYYKMWKYAFHTLRQCRSPNRVDYPRTFVQMHQAKRSLEREVTKVNKIKTARATRRKKKKPKAVQTSISLDEFW